MTRSCRDGPTKHKDGEMPEETPATPDPAKPEDSPTPEPPKQTEPVAPTMPPEIKAILDKERKIAHEAEKARKAAEAKVQEYEDRDKSEAEKAAERLVTTEKERDDARRETARYKVAADKNVDPSLLHGDSEEAMAEMADRLIEWRGEPKPNVPQPDPSQGPRPAAPQDAEDAEYAKFYPNETPNRK